MRTNFSLEDIKIENYLLNSNDDPPAIRQQLKEERKKSEKPNQTKELKSHTKNESFLRFKLEKKLKQKKHNFLLENLKSHERMMTEPDLTQERTVEDHTEQKSEADEKVIPKMLKKNDKHVRSELEEFTKNFVNQNNFLQSQHLSAYRKRIKTESEYQGVELIDRMKS